MMKQMAVCISVILTVFSTSIYAVRISDIPNSDSAFPSIKRSVEEGYLSLFSDAKFNPDEPLTRKEAAIVIDKLSQKISEQKMDLSRAEVQELMNLSKNFKTYLSNNESDSNSLMQTIKNLKVEQDTIHEDMSKLTEDHETQIAELKTQDTNLFYWLIGGVGLASMIAILH